MRKILMKPRVLIINPDTRLNHALVAHFVRMDRCQVFSSLKHESSLMMITGVTPKQRFDVVVTHFGGLAIDFNYFVHRIRKAAPATKVLLFCKRRKLDGLLFDEVVFENGSDSIEILERKVGLLFLSQSKH